MDAMADPVPPRTDDDAEREAQQIDVALGAELRGLRSKRGLSQDQLAELSGVGKRTIIRLENGERPMTMRQLYRFCQALGVKPSVLINAMEGEVGI